MQVYHADDAKHRWKPQLNQYCWFYNFTYDYPILGKFISMHSRNKPNGYMYCEPFMGELPSYLKEQ